MRKQPANKRYLCRCGSVKGNHSKRCSRCAGIPDRGSRTKQVITEVANGLTFKEIALKWNRSLKTVEYHWGAAKAKFHLHSQVDAVKCALRNEWISL